MGAWTHRPTATLARAPALSLLVSYSVYAAINALCLSLSLSLLSLCVCVCKSYAVVAGEIVCYSCKLWNRMNTWVVHMMITLFPALRTTDIVILLSDRCIGLTSVVQFTELELSVSCQAGGRPAYASQSDSFCALSSLHISIRSASSPAVGVSRGHVGKCAFHYDRGL